MLTKDWGLGPSVAIYTVHSDVEQDIYEGRPTMDRVVTRERINARAKTRSEKTDETRCRILEESIKLFLEQGYDKTTVRQIILKAGILNGSLYNIYKSKDEIFIDIAGVAFSEASELMDEIIGPDAPPEKVLCFPACIQIYASFRSPRIAELLSVAHTKWEIFQSAMGFYKKWLEDKAHLWRGLTDEPGFDLKIIAFSGSMGSVLKTIAEEPVRMSEEECMRIMCAMELRTFGFDDSGVDGYVKSIVSALDSREIRIFDIEI